MIDTVKKTKKLEKNFLILIKIWNKLLQQSKAILGKNKPERKNNKKDD